MFVESVCVSSRKYIPRGCRTEYIPGLTDESKSLYEAYKFKYSRSPFDDDTIESENTLIEKNDGGKKEEMGGSHHVHQYDAQ